MPYFNEEVSNLLETFATCNRCFTIKDVMEWSSEAKDAAPLRKAFCEDSRFILLSERGWGPECFLPERTMFRWWTNLNFRLARIRQPRLTERQLTASVNSLRPGGLWFTPPVDILNYGQKFGFVSPAWTNGFYVFPLAHLLSQTTPMVLGAFKATLVEFTSPEIRNDAIRKPVSDGIESVLSQFPQRTSHIVRAREGIPPYKKMTLEELGTAYGCTRERIRQIESKFWKRMKHPQVRGRSPVIAILLVELMRRQGSLLLDPGQEETIFTCFLAKCLGVPYIRTKVGNFVLLGYSESDLIELNLPGSVAEVTDSDRVAEQLDCGVISYLGRGDLGQVANAIAENRYSRLSKQEKVYLALRHIGQPAHFSAITETYASLFPDDSMSQRNVHAILSRCASPDFEQYGIVWIGVRGTYALREQGYKRPDMGIYDTVATIVEKKYRETQKPVHITLITAELGKYRHAVHPASLAFATGVNPRLEQVSKDFFIPKDPQREAQTEGSTSDLDRILREFQADHAGDF